MKEFAKPVVIFSHTEGDSRTATEVPTIEQFSRANQDHIHDVKRTMSELAKLLNSAGKNHDWTKIKEPYKSQFYQDLCNTISGTMKFNDGEWSKNHYNLERHHLLRNCPDDVDLLDVIEMIVDCTVAGLARSGEIRKLEISDDILRSAVSNTVKLIENNVRVNEE